MFVVLVLVVVVVVIVVLVLVVVVVVASVVVAINLVVFVVVVFSTIKSVIKQHSVRANSKTSKSSLLFRFTIFSFSFDNPPYIPGDVIF